MSESRLRVGELDRLFAGRAIVCVVGPVEGPATEILPRLRWMVRSEPANRIGVIPDAHSVRWRRTEPDESWLITDRDFAVDDIEGAIRRLHARPSSPPVQVGLERGHLLLRVDHGVGDMGLIFAIVATLSQPGSPSRIMFDSTPTGFGLRRPIARVLRRELVNDPVETTRAGFDLIGSRLRRSGQDQSDTSQVAEVIGDPTSVFVRSDCGYIDVLVAERAGMDANPSVSALLAYAVSTELVALDSGLTEIDVVVSLRGRTGDRREAAGNLTAVTSVPLGPTSQFVGQFDRAVRSPRVPVQLALSLALSSVTRGRSRARRSGPSVSISNLTRAASAARIAWSGPPPVRTCAVGAPLNGPGCLAVVLTQVGSEVQATVHLDRTRHQPEDVRRAVGRALAAEWWNR